MIHARTDYNDRVKCVDGSIPENEPVFLIRGQDKLAVDMMIAYTNAYITAGGCDPGVLLSLGAHTARMSKWPKKKLADMPEGEMYIGDCCQSCKDKHSK